MSVAFMGVPHAASADSVQMPAYPTHEGRWLAHSGTTAYVAEVREIVPGVFEALVHGYSMEYHPTCFLTGHFDGWSPVSPAP